MSQTSAGLQCRTLHLSGDVAVYGSAVDKLEATTEVIGVEHNEHSLRLLKLSLFNNSLITQFLLLFIVRMGTC